MRVFREPEPDYGKEALTFALGAFGGLAIGLMLSRREGDRPVSGLGSDLRERARQAGERARTAVRRVQPARLRRLAREQSELTELEDAVLEAFISDDVLSERGVDVGAISPGIIELSGEVWSADEAERAVRIASGVAGVRTVVNRLDHEDEGRSLSPTRRPLSDEAGGVTSLQHGMARTGGMGTRRQGRQTDPARPDDSQHREHRSLHEADRDQWVDEGYAARTPHMSERPEVQDPWRADYSEGELDNQDPHDKHANHTQEWQAQDLNSDARVGEGMKPGTRMAIEQSGLAGEGSEADEEERREGE